MINQHTHYEIDKLLLSIEFMVFKLHFSCLFSDPPVPAQEAEKFAFRIGDTATIKCQFQAVPEPIFTWSKDGNIISNEDDRFTITILQGDGDNLQSHLQINKMLESDTGTYTCEGENMLGSSTTNLILQIVSE